MAGAAGYASGLLVAFGTRAACAGVLSTWALLIVGGMHLTGAGLLREAALIAACGLLQTLLALPLTPQPELTGPPVRSGVRAHGARLAVGLMVAVALYEAFDLRFGYWLPVTVLLVLQPTYERTIVRILERALGTLAGVAVASLCVTVVHPPDATIVVLLAVLAAAGYALYFASYALSTVLLTMLVALLVEFGGGSPIGALGDRTIDTVAGAAIALAAVTVDRVRAEPARSAGPSAAPCP